MNTLPMALHQQQHNQLCLFLFVALTLCLFHGTISTSISQFGVDEDDDDSEDKVVMVQSGQTQKGCDFSSGKWLFDESYPLYDSSCPYISTEVTCQKNGRPDSDYQRWRWKPNGCSVPRFNALKFLAKMRKKRIMLVGDSMMRNQWESLVCLVQSVVPTGRKRIAYNGPSMAFHAMDFETTIEFTWAPLLVELKKGAKNRRVLHLDSIEENAEYWRGVDVLVFDSAHWWIHSDNKTAWDYFVEGKAFNTTMNPMIAYQKGLTTWAKWIDLNLDPAKTRVFFRTMSPRHNRENGWKCYNQKQPIAAFNRPRVPEESVVLRGVLRKMRFPVYLQDITAMSSYRKDGHPSVYRRGMGEEERQNPRGLSSDCSHWCLPGERVTKCLAHWALSQEKCMS